MPDEFLKDRKKALEESFFARQNARLIEKLAADRKRAAAKESLAKVAGIVDEAVLDQLVALDIAPETWAAMALVPLLEVAWADGKVQEKERRAVLAAAEAHGIAAGSPSHQLLDDWLSHRPDARLLQAWGEYIVGLCARLGEAEKRALRDEILGRARAVSQAAGGILALGRTSPEEAAILAQLAKAFEA